MESAEIAKKATEAALDKQATDILMLDIRQISSFADYFVICSADSDRQINAICDEIDRVLSKNGVHLYRREGDADSGWVILDFSRVIVHVFAQSQREYYDLEHLWSKATPVVRIL
ncbi:MAG: ribosome silencing factor [Chloroflexi bacterium]|nr:ribosome silencing factor [Chloroflexota bacterium]